MLTLESTDIFPFAIVSYEFYMQCVSSVVVLFVVYRGRTKPLLFHSRRVYLWLI